MVKYNSQELDLRIDQIHLYEIDIDDHTNKLYIDTSILLDMLDDLEDIDHDFHIHFDRNNSDLNSDQIADNWLIVCHRNHSKDKNEFHHENILNLTIDFDMVNGSILFDELNPIEEWFD